MKKNTIVAFVFIFIAGIAIVGCDTPGQKVENAQNDVAEANRNLEKANEEYLADIESYRKETADKITDNEKSIAEFKARVEDQKRDAKQDYQDKITALEQKNSDMKKKLEDYKAEGKDKWETFKTDFSKSMVDLGNSFKDLTAKSSK
jgi:predicted RNase H-like nuclease (RuvC/YqgF family)